METHTGPGPPVALFLFQRSNGYQARLEADGLAAAQRLGFRLAIHDAAGDPERQVAQIRASVRGTAPPLALVVHPVVDGLLQEPAREAARRGVGWVLLNREHDYVDDLRLLYPRAALFSVSPDQEEIGRAQGRMVRHLLPTARRLLCIDGPAGASSARLRRRGLEEVLHGSGLQVVHKYGDWSFESGVLAVRSWEQHFYGAEHTQRALSAFLPDAIVAQNDAMAQGARRELAEVAKRRRTPVLALLPIIGCDGTPESVQLVQEGLLLGTVVVPSTSGPALEALAAHRNRGIDPGPHLRLPVTTVPEVVGPACPDCGLSLDEGHASSGCAAL